MRKLAVLALLALLLSCRSALANDVCSEENLARILKELEYLSDKRVDADGLVREFDVAVRACEGGERSKAEEMLTKVSAKVTSLLSEAERVFALKLAKTVTEVVSLLLVPVLVYIYLPRVYLSLWYRSRKYWYVVKKR